MFQQGESLVSIDKIKPYPNNPRIHSSAQIELLAKHIQDVGFDTPIVVDENMVIIKGHGRLEALKYLGQTEALVKQVKGLTEIQKKTARIADNKLQEMAVDDLDALKVELEDLAELGVELLDLGIDEDLLGDLVEDEAPMEGNTDDDAVPEVDDNPYNVQRGDIWLLGKHRVMCGDSTDKADVDRLMDGRKADMVFTDPPYGVNYTKKTKEVLKTENYTEIKNDDLKLDELKVFFEKAFGNAALIMKDSCQYYFFSPQGGDSEMMMMMMRKSGIKCRHQLIWVKDSPVFSMGRLDYDYKHEPILYGWKKKHTFYRKGSQDKSVWEFKRTENKLHPTMKPVELIENALLNSSTVGHFVYDLFLGSGSTLIACEKTNRTCYGMEIDPHYVSVIIKRWEDFTGEKAVKVQ